MNVVIVFNPIAGAGRAAEAGRRLDEALRGAGHRVALVEARVEPADRWLAPAVSTADVVVALGGDGTVRLAAPVAAEAGAAVYHFPVGTENLFSREFGMNDDPARLIEALRSPRYCEMDLGAANGEPFLLMVSVGYDAEVIHELARRRRGAISHLSYAAPMIRQFLRWRPRTMAVEVDGRRIDGGRPGFVVIANSRQYARRLDPAREAKIDDGLLDVVFFPASSRLAVIAWAWRCWRGRQLRHPGCVLHRGRAVRVASETPQAYQVDGDVPRGIGGSACTPLEVAIRPRALRVLLPPAPGGR